MEWQVVMESHVTNRVVVIKMKFAVAVDQIQYISHIALRKLQPLLLPHHILTVLLLLKKP
jgi:hypothetical protein